MARTAEQKMTKMEAVRRSLSELGKEAKPVQLQAHIREKFGIDMGTDHISTYKGTILKTKRNKKKSAKMSIKTLHAGWANGAHAKPASTCLSEQVAMLKTVAGTIGKEEAKRIIDLL
jgi:hypothetical protein